MDTQQDDAGLHDPTFWDKRSLLTYPVRCKPLRWLDRPVATLLGIEPRMLSSRVRVPRVPFTGPLRHRCKMYLWEHHSVAAAVNLSIILGLSLFTLAMVLALIVAVPMLGTDDDIHGIPMILVATAAYCGALLGFLQAVAIFSIQLRSQQTHSSLSLTPLIARRYFTFFILAVAAGVTIANLLASFLAPLLPFSRDCYAALTWIDLLAVPLITVLGVWYLAAIVSEAGTSDISVALPVIQATMRAQAHADARTLTLANEYISHLKAAGIEFTPFADTSFRSTQGDRTRLPLSRQGVLTDVDCYLLEALGNLLLPMAHSHEFQLGVLVGLSVDTRNALVARQKQMNDGTAPEPFDDNLKAACKRLLDRALCISGSESNAL